MKRLFLPLLIVLVVSGCTGNPTNPANVPTLKGQAHATLLDAERIVTQVAVTLSEYRQAGIIVRGSSDEAKLKKALKEAGDALDEAWRTYHLANFTDALSGAKTAKQLYFSIRKDLIKLGGSP